MIPQSLATLSPLGYGLSCTFCTVVLPFPDGSGGFVLRAVTTIQMPFGIGTSTTTGAVLPSNTSGRPLLVEAIIRRLSTVRGTLPDSAVPTTVAQYGIDLLDAIGADLDTQGAGELAAMVDSQIRQEERIVDSTTAPTLIGNLLILAINLIDGAGPFRLVLSIDLLTRNLQILSAPV